MRESLSNVSDFLIYLNCERKSSEIFIFSFLNLILSKVEDLASLKLVCLLLYRYFSLYIPCCSLTKSLEVLQ